MPYRLLIALGAGLISAVVFASATTGPVLMRLILLVLTPLALFLAGLGLGPTAALVAGAAGAALVLVAGAPLAALVFVASQAIPVFILTYLATLHRQSADGSVEWYPVGRLVVAAALLAGLFSVLTFFLLGGDLEMLRGMLRDMLKKFVANELPKMPDAPKIGPEDIDDVANLAVALLPSASAIWSMSSLVFNLWLAGRITLASGRLQRPWPDIAAMSYPGTTPLLLAVSTALGFLDGMIGIFARGFAGTLFFAYMLLGLAVVHYVTRGQSWRMFALWGLYGAMLVTNSIASLAIALLGLAEQIWPMRKPKPPPDGPPV